MDPITKYHQENLDTYIEYLHQMVDINSFTANPEGVNRLGEWTADLFAELGFTPIYIPSNNPRYGKHLFLAKEGETNKNLALISHLDTVFPPEEEIKNDFKWRIEGDRIYGPGTVDIKGGTVMIYMILKALRTLKPQIYNRINWQICLDASEEALSLDFSQHCLERLNTETLGCLVFEGGHSADGMTSLVTSRKGRATFKVEVAGRAGHAGNAHHLGANAIVQLAYTIQKIANLTDYKRDLTFNVGVIRGGSVVNRVPHFAEAIVEMRVFSPQVFDEALSSMLSLGDVADVTSQDGYPCEVRVQVLDKMAPWVSNSGTLKLFRTWQAVGDTLGMKVIQEARGGLSDGNPLSNHYPTIDGLGPVGANSHCSESSLDGSKEQEYVLISSFVPKATLNTYAILNLIENNA